MKTAIELKLSQIATSILSYVEGDSDHTPNGLYNGNYGILLFLYYYCRYTGDAKAISITESFSEKLLAGLDKDTVSHTYCGGLSGILYLFEFLKEQDFVDIDISEVKEDLTSYLLSHMRQNIRQNYYDFMHGALGVGLYFLKTGEKPEYIDELLDFLSSIAEIDEANNTYKWKSILDIKTREVGYNIALSHGISSIVLFLVRVLKIRPENSRARSLLTGTVNYLLSQEIDPKKFGSMFPSKSNKELNGSRLAWCYGDLGVATALWQAGEIMNNKTWKEKGLNAFIKSTERLTPDETTIRDACICHGSAGVAMIYRRMYLETEIEIFLTALNYWIDYTLKLAHFSDDTTGYMFSDENGWKSDYHLLNGISGIGLMLLSYTENTPQEWDTFFLLS